MGGGRWKDKRLRNREERKGRAGNRVWLDEQNDGWKRKEGRKKEELKGGIDLTFS